MANHVAFAQYALTAVTEVFSIPTKEFLHHETTVWLPYFIKRHILRQKIPKPASIIKSQSKVEHQLKGEKA